jgi:hypothetical protein
LIKIYNYVLTTVFYYAVYSAAVPEQLTLHVWVHVDSQP